MELKPLTEGGRRRGNRWSGTREEIRFNRIVFKDSFHLIMITGAHSETDIVLTILNISSFCRIQFSPRNVTGPVVSAYIPGDNIHALLKFKPGSFSSTVFTPHMMAVGAGFGSILHKDWKEQKGTVKGYWDMSF